MSYFKSVTIMLDYSNISQSFNWRNTTYTN